MTPKELERIIYDDWKTHKFTLRGIARIYKVSIKKVQEIILKRSVQKREGDGNNNHKK